MRLHRKSVLLLGTWEKARGANDQEMTTSIGETLSDQHKVSVQPNHLGLLFFRAMLIKPSRNVTR